MPDSVHFIMMLSNNNWMFKGLENLVQSIKINCSNKTYFSCIFQGEKKENNAEITNKFGMKKIKYEEIEKITKFKNSRIVRENVEFIYCPYFWELGLPCRWFIKPKSEICIMIDVDMLCCNSLDEVFSLDKNKMHGCIALDNSYINRTELNKIGISEKTLNKYYINFGFVVVPSKYLIDIGTELFHSYPTLEKKFKYYTGQVALANSMKKLNIPLNILNPQKYNCYDCFLPHHNKKLINKITNENGKITFEYENSTSNEPIFLHLMDNRQGLYENQININQTGRYALRKIKQYKILFN